MRKSREKYLLYTGMFAALLPVFMMRDFTISNELRYLSIADEALRNHSLFAFTNHGIPYADKPPLYIWVLMFCRWITGAHHLWLLSLFSFIPALYIVRVMDGWVKNDSDGESRALARLMLLTSGLFIVVAVTLRMDMMMCMFIVLALRTFWRMITESGNQRRDNTLFAVFVFLAIFTKGALGLLIPLLCTSLYLALSGESQRILHVWGLRTWGILLALSAIWFGAVYAEGGSGYLQDLVLHQTIGRTINSFHHNNPFYYYAVCIWYSLAPWSLLIVGVTAAALRPGFIRSDLQRFFLTTGIATMVLLSCVSAKLQIYMLPAVPFLVYGSAMFLPRFHDNRWLRASLAIPAAMLALSLPALKVASTMTGMAFLNTGMLYAAATILTMSGLKSLYMLYGKGRHEPLTDTMRCMGRGIIVAIFMGGWAFTSINGETGYGDLCRKALEISRKKGIDDFRTWDMRRAENMDVYLQKGVEIMPHNSVPAAPDSPYILMTRKRNAARLHGNEMWNAGPYIIVLMRPGGKTTRQAEHNNEDKAATVG